MYLSSFSRIMLAPAFTPERVGADTSKVCTYTKAVSGDDDDNIVLFSSFKLHLTGLCYAQTSKTPPAQLTPNWQPSSKNPKICLVYSAPC